MTLWSLYWIRALSAYKLLLQFPLLNKSSANRWSSADDELQPAQTGFHSLDIWIHLGTDQGGKIVSRKAKPW